MNPTPDRPIAKRPEGESASEKHENLRTPPTEHLMSHVWPPIAIVVAVLVMTGGLMSGVLSVSASAVLLAITGAAWIGWWVRQPAVGADELGVSHAR